MPLASEFFPELEDAVFFFDGPFIASHTRVNDVDPALTTLPRFPVAAWTHRLVEFFSDASPLLGLIQITAHALRGNVLSDFLENLRFPGRPRRLLALNVLDEQPALLALKAGASWHQVGDRLPV